MHQNLDPYDALGALLLLSMAFLALFYDGGIGPPVIRFLFAGLLVLWAIVIVWPTRAKRSSRTPIVRQMLYVALLAIVLILAATPRPGSS